MKKRRPASKKRATYLQDYPAFRVAGQVFLLPIQGGVMCPPLETTRLRR